ncbi:MAG: hypothetical protein J6K29_06145 [Clostridia bacterium]|nr:hypothetical protein [Clostridia bacterium]
MTNQDIFRELTNITPAYILDAAPRAESASRRRSRLLRWGSLAACICLVAVLAIHIKVAFTPAQMTDVFREGTCMELTDLAQLPARYDGAALVEGLGAKSYEFYYKEGGDPTDPADWYSLLVSEGIGNGQVVLHCMFGDPDLEDWKVDMVFTKKATETRVIHGVEVQIARQQPSLRAEYWYYTIFKYDGVVYDLRTLSDDAGYVDEVLERMLGELE